jgi:hypothetical protein
LLIGASKRAAAGLALIVATALTVGCSASHPGSDARPSSDLLHALTAASDLARWSTPDHQPVAFRQWESHLIVYQAPAEKAFVLRQLSKRETRIDEESAGTVLMSATQPATAINAVSRQHWLAGSHASVGQAPTSQTLQFQAGQFNFLPRGSTLTFQQARALGADPTAVGSVLRQHLIELAPEAADTVGVFRDAGVLLAAAPLRPASRIALWRLVFDLPGAHECGQRSDLAGRRGAAICVTGGNQAAAIVMDRTTAAVLAVQLWLTSDDPTYPTMQAGDLIQDDTYLPMDSQAPCDSSC